jgi:hypothetical protein
MKVTGQKTVTQRSTQQSDLAEILIKTAKEKGEKEGACESAISNPPHRLHYLNIRP